MGMFDTIYLDKEHACPICGRKIKFIQTKEFENILENYYAKDCIAHSEDIRIIINYERRDECRQI